MNELKSCPFCGGKARLTARDDRNRMWKGDKPCVSYKIRAICNKCHSMGKPIRTDWTPLTFWHIGCRSKEADEFFNPYQEKAIEKWNNRAVIE